MSTRTGHIQREVSAIFKATPTARFSVRDLAKRVYPDREVTVSETNTVNRVLRQLTPSLGLTRCRASRSGERGYRHVWGLK